MKRLNTLKKIGFVILFFLLHQTLKAQNEFIFIWEATNNEKKLDIPTNNDYAYNYTVNWGDGSINNNIAGDTDHTYLNNGIYTVTITGAFPTIYFDKSFNADYKLQILSIEQWGNNQWKTMEGAFYGCKNMVINANDVPSLSQCNSMKEMFYNCTAINNGTYNKWNLWNTSTILDMSDMFNSSRFNQPIGNWNVSNVTNMSNMFKNNTSFNQDISNWNVGNVTNMSNMFADTNFNTSIANWNVSNVTDMRAMFYNSIFNLPIANWVVSNVTHMGGMFAYSKFNQPIANWNVSNVANMSEMFQYSEFNQPIDNWNTQSLESMSYIFNKSHFNQPLGNWDTSNVNEMLSVFEGAQNFDQDISTWNVRNVRNCLDMFKGVTLSSVNYDALLIGWNAQFLRSNVQFHGGYSQHSSIDAANARQNMINVDNWTITDGVVNTEFIWTGAISTNWGTAGNWNRNAVPTANDDVRINNVANLPRVNFNQNYVVKNLTTLGKVNIKNNASLTVNENLDQRADIQVESFVNGNGSFIVKGNQININPPNLTYLRYISGNNWHLISSPVFDADIDTFAANTQLAEGQGNNRGIGFYDSDTDPNWSYYQNGANNTGNFINGKGYSIRTTANAFLNFTGKLRTYDSFTFTETSTGWILAGNPYPAFINANSNANENDNFLSGNLNNLDPAFANVYVWNPTTTSYEPIGNGLGARYIAPGQAFFVKSNGRVGIDKTMLTHQSGDLFLKTNQTQKIVLKIDDNTNTSETTIAFKNEMTHGLDITYDAAVFSGESKNLSIYSHLLEDNNNVPFAIQFLPALENNDFIIPLGIKQNEASELTLSLKETTISSDVKIYLEDTLENTFTEISNDANYKFSHQNDASETGRFYVHFQQKALHINTIDASKISIYKDNNNAIQVKGISNGVLNMYSITGQQILKNRRVNSNSATIQIPKISRGVYLLKINFEGKEYVQKMLF
mgnify:CR=1 FL=1